MATRPSGLAMLTVVESGLQDLTACWRALEEKIDVGYQIFFAPAQGSFLVLEGDLPRAEVERCAEATLVYNRLLIEDELAHEGDLTVARTHLGTVYAAWRGRFVVLGSRDRVTQALAGDAPAWREPLASLSRGRDLSTEAISVDQTFAVVLGVPTRSWKLVIESAPPPWPKRELVPEGQGELERFAAQEEEKLHRQRQGLPPTPDATSSTAPTTPPQSSTPPSPAAGKPPRPPSFAGRVEISYATPAEARRAAQALTQGTFGIPLEETFAAALTHLPQSVAQATLIVRFTQDHFVGISLADLQAWLASAQAQRQAP
jgi:hypothetical protein